MKTFDQTKVSYLRMYQQSKKRNGFAIEYRESNRIEG